MTSSNPTCSTTARRPEIGIEIGIVLNDFSEIFFTLRRSQVTPRRERERERGTWREGEREREKSQKRKFK
jgi:hypothetical protein